MLLSVLSRGIFYRRGVRAEFNKGFLMKLFVQKMGAEETIESILWFQTDDTTAYWREPLFRKYSFLDKEKGLNANWDDRKAYIEKELTGFYSSVQSELELKAEGFNKYWMEKSEAITEIFSETFGIDCRKILNDMTAEISLNPICPRFLEQNSFTVFYGDTPQEFLETALHEIIHFVWFHIWQKHFADDTDEYNAPHLKWLLSEMVVDTFVNNSKIGQLFSEQARTKTVYNYFYTMTVGGQPILKALSDMYDDTKKIERFMELAYEYCQSNENEILEQVR